MLPNPIKYLYDCYKFKKYRQSKSHIPMEQLSEMPLKAIMSHSSVAVYESTYFGINTNKCPNDFWAYQEMVCNIKPDFIIEIGNANGGVLLALAHYCENLSHGEVIGIDINHSSIDRLVKNHSRITLLTGDALGLVEKVESIIGFGKKVLIIEDSLPRYDHKLKILKSYNHLVSVGSYFVIEYTSMGYGFPTGDKKLVYDAVQEFIAENPSRFEIDRSLERFIITFNPCGYLKKIAN